MPIKIRTVKFDFKDRSSDKPYVTSSVEFFIEKEIIDRAEDILKEKGFDAFRESLPISMTGSLNWDNMYAFHSPYDVYEVMDKEELHEHLKKEIPGYE